MTPQGKKQDVQQQYQPIRDIFKKWLREATEHRSLWQLRSFATESFYNGMTHVVFDKATRTVRETPVDADNSYHIPKLKTLVRAIKVRLTKNAPRWHVSHAGDATADEKRAAEKLLSNAWLNVHMNDKLKEVIQHSCLKTLGWAYVTWDEENNFPQCHVEDPFNILTSPDGRLEGPVFVGKYMIRAVRKSLDEIRTNPRYANGEFKSSVAQLHAERQMSADKYKDSLLSPEYRVPLDDKDGGTLLYELYCFDNDDELGGNPDNRADVMAGAPKGRRLRRLTFVGEGAVIIGDEWLKGKKFPLLAYAMESNGGTLYHPSWMFPLVDLNRALNRGYGNRADWFEKFARGRWTVQKGSRMTAVNGKNGQVIEWDKMRPEFLQAPSLPESSEVHISETERYMEDTAGAHADAMGRSSSKYASGRTTMSIIAADMENQGEPVDRLQTFVQEIAYQMLELADQYMGPRRVDGESMVGASLAAEAEAVTGQEMSPEIKRVKPIEGIQVEIVPGSAFSDLQAREDLMEMRKAGIAIPDELIIEAYKLGNTAEIMDKFLQEQRAKQEQEDGQDAVEAKQAGLENKKLAAGARVVPQEGENHQVHLAVHGQFLASMQEGSKEADAVANHMRQHEALGNPAALTQPMEARKLALEQGAGNAAGYQLPPDMASLQDNRLK